MVFFLFDFSILSIFLSVFINLCPFFMLVLVLFMCPNSGSHGTLSCAPRISVFKTRLILLFNNFRLGNLLFLFVFWLVSVCFSPFLVLFMFWNFFKLFYFIFFHIFPLFCWFLFHLFSLILPHMGWLHVRQELVFLKRYC